MNDKLLEQMKSIKLLKDEELEKASFLELALYLQELNALEKLYVSICGEEVKRDE